MTTNIIEHLEHRGLHSPDFPERRLEERIPVFVYGTLKRGLGNHRVIEGGEFQSVAYLLGQGTYKMRDTGGFPVVYRASLAEKGVEPSSARIIGELYSVDPLTLAGLDQLEGNGYMYKREMIRIVVRQGRDQYKAINAWVYIGMEDAFDYLELNDVPLTIINGRPEYNWFPSEDSRQTYVKTYG